VQNERRCGLGLALSVMLLLAACSQQQHLDQTPAGAPALSPRQTLVYECGEYEFVARTGADQITLYLPDGSLLLARQVSASGSRYSDGETSLWSKGNEARLELGPGRIRSCVLNRARAPWEEARLRGIDFRAVGQEPGWYLELQHDGQMLFVAQYGSQRVLMDTPDPVFEGGREIYRPVSQGHEMKLEIELRHCTDVMSGEIYDSQVSVYLDDNVYRGCGLALEPW
jgi:membrane-bound inhibitor of C-type lysozyme/uncharacterized membrane protein